MNLANFVRDHLYLTDLFESLGGLSHDFPLNSLDGLDSSDEVYVAVYHLRRILTIYEQLREKESP